MISQTTINRIVNDYFGANNTACSKPFGSTKQLKDAELEEYGKMSGRTQIEAVVKGLRCNPSTGKFVVGGTHQRCLSAQKKDDAINIIFGKYQPLSVLQSCADFEELYDTVKNDLITVFPNDCLTIYDLSLRIGSAIGIIPEKYVYLFRGAREGAKALLGPSAIKGQFRVDIKLFGKYFPNVSSVHIEDILCIYKDELAGKSSTPTRRGCANIKPHGCI